MEQLVQTEVWKAQTLQELIQILHRLFSGDKVSVEEVQALMESYESNPVEWMKYAQFDQYRYTRNLVDKGNGKFNLMILCWGEGHGSYNQDDYAKGIRRSGHSPTKAHAAKRLLVYKVPQDSLLLMPKGSIHDHTDSHCFMKILQGNLKETLFEWPGKKGTGAMTKKSERVLEENQCAYINEKQIFHSTSSEHQERKYHLGMAADSIGLHRVENTSHTESAVSLHLYSPPFDSCNTFDQRTGHKHNVKMTFYSQFGERTPGATVVSQENN